MRTRTLSLAAVLALGVSAPALANDYIGTVELGAGWSLVDTEGFAEFILDDDSYPLVEGVARGNIPLGRNWALQLDAGGLGTFGTREDGEDYLQTVFYSAAHLNWRTPDYAFGVLTHLGSANAGQDENANFYNFGAEGLGNWGNFTLIGQGGYFIADDEDQNSTMTDAWWVRGVGRFYAGPNTRFQAEGSYADGEQDVDFCAACNWEMSAVSWGARVDHAFSGGPVALYLGYKGNKVDNDFFPLGITDHTISVGFNLHFGAGSLEETDRRGPSFDTPDVGRWTGWSTGIVGLTP